MTTFTLPRSGLPPLRFAGEQLAESLGSRSPDGRDYPRYHDLGVYRTTAGRWVVAIVYVTRWQGETGFALAEVRDTAAGAAAVLTGYDPVAHFAGLPPGDQYAEKQRRLLADLRLRYQSQVADVLSAAGITEEADEMPSTPKTYRLDEEALESLGRLQDLYGYGSATEAVERAVASWEMALALAADEAAGLLDRREWNAAADANNGTDFVGLGSAPGRMLAANVEDAHRLEGLGEKWLADEGEGGDSAVKALSRKLWSMTFEQGSAVARAVVWFWRHATEIDHATDEWWTPAFRRKFAARAAKKES